MSITGRGRRGYLTGTVKDPGPSDPRAQVNWETENAMIMSWLIHSMEPEIGQVYQFHSMAKEIWDAVTATYSDKGYYAQAFAVKLNLKDTRQGSRNITKYFNQLKGL